MRTLAALAVLLAACTDSRRITVHPPTDMVPVFEAFAAPIPWEELAVDPAGEDEGGYHVVLELDDTRCGECYRVDGEGRRYTVSGGDVLGLQYGLAHLLEGMGFRWLHPAATHVPPRPKEVFDPHVIGTDHAPEVARRGLDLHTLHPTEAMRDFWVPSDDGLERATRVVDWAVKNRADYLQWAALGDVLDDPAAAEAWAAHTRAIVDTAHRRGLDTGIGIQLFGSGDLQRAFHLVDQPGSEEAMRASMHERLSLLAEAADFDVYNLSFGEFTTEDPQVLIDGIDLAWATLQEVAPGADMTATVHVGNNEGTRVEYDGEEQLYYLLVRYADPAVVPWVHSVMYYTLYDPTGGAYGHEEFAEHRTFLLERLQASEPVGYFPETAYWVAFDNSVPNYLPLYVRSRWRDLSETRRLAEAAGGATLQDHVLFSSGWEWGYWLHDVATLRMGYRLPDDDREAFAEQLVAFGADGEVMADLLSELAQLQHEGLIEQGLAPYLASRDTFIDVGDQLGIHSQPDRPTFAELVALDANGLAAFGPVLRDLSTYLVASRGLAQRAYRLRTRTLDDPFGAEVRDGLELNYRRASFVYATWSAAYGFAVDGDEAGWLARAADELIEGQRIVARRHAALHDPVPRTLLQRRDNPTVYPYGYLHHADTLCFWHRELAEVRDAVLGTDEDIPGCAL